jgi:hypothetical protein
MKKTPNRNVDSGSKPDAAPQDSATSSTNAAVPRQTKAALLRALLGAPGGASLTRIMTETGWQAHTVRAALTGLRKAGLHLIRRREGEVTIYAIDAAAEVTPPGADAIDGELKEPNADLSVPDDDGSSPASTDHGPAVAEVGP